MKRRMVKNDFKLDVQVVNRKTQEGSGRGRLELFVLD